MIMNFKAKYLCTFIGFVLVLSVRTPCLPSFPGAKGFGNVTTGGRGGTVYHVTNLNDTGAGSFRDAVSGSGRIIVFDISGYIVASSPVVVKSDITIAGQTAPGEGIGLMGAEVSFSNSTNIVCRHIRFRQGDLDPNPKKSGLNLLNTDRVMLDHVSIEFAQYDGIDAVGCAHVTVQNCMLADPIGQQFAAHIEGDSISWWRNLFANAHNRNPLAKSSTQYVNNVVYDYQAGYTAGNTGGVHSHDIIGNVFMVGPATTNASDAFYQMANQSVWAKDNILDANKDGVLDNTPASWPGDVKLSGPWASTSQALATFSAKDAYAWVAAHAGASLHRDQVDSNVVSQVLSMGKIGSMWTHQIATGLTNNGYGIIRTGKDSIDSDGNGIPDWWKKKHGLSLTNVNAATQTNLSADGYTNLEMYLDEIAGDSVVYSSTAINPVAPIRGAPRLLGNVLRFDLASESEIHVDALDLSGRILFSIFHGVLRAGEASVPMNLTGRREGVVILRVKIGSELAYCTPQMRF
jgi:hypothetical protein